MVQERMSPGFINTCRGLVTWVLRSAAVVLCAGGAYLILKRVLLGIGVRDRAMIHAVFEGIGEGHSLYRGLAMIIVGSALGLLSKTISRWVLPVPSEGCPRCGYEKVDTDQCPECGLRGFAPRDRRPPPGP
jgi:hypothetical protein